MYQFIHIETYARKASTKVKPSKPKNEKQAAAAAARSARSADAGDGGAKGMDAYVGTIQTPKTRANVSDVVGEALRDPEHCPHVENAEPPTFLVGDEATLRGLPDEIERNLTAYHVKNGGKKVRSDAHVLLAGVASYPRELEQTDPAAYERWEKSTVKWLQEKYGDNLRCVLRHDDEAHPHIHFYVCDRERVNAKELHDGYAAAAHLPMSAESKIVHNDAMRDFQSDYYAKVGHASGLLRDGPKRLRETRIVYKAREREALERVALDSASENARVQLLDGASVEAKQAVEMRRQVEREAGALAVERVELEQLRDTTQRDRAAVDAEWAKAREAHAAAAKSKTDINDKVTVLEKQTDALKRARAAADEAKAEAELSAVALRTKKAEAVAVYKKYEAQISGLAALKDVAEIMRKPDAVGMLEFIEQNPDVRSVLNTLKQEPHLAQTFILIGAQSSEPASYNSPASGASQSFLDSLENPGEVATLEEQKQKPKSSSSGSGTGFGTGGFGL